MKVFCDTRASDVLQGVTFTFGHFIMGLAPCAYLNITQNLKYREIHLFTLSWGLIYSFLSYLKHTEKAVDRQHYFLSF